MHPGGPPDTVAVNPEAAKKKSEVKRTRRCDVLDSYERPGSCWPSKTARLAPKVEHSPPTHSSRYALSYHASVAKEPNVTCGFKPEMVHVQSALLPYWGEPSELEEIVDPLRPTHGVHGHVPLQLRLGIWLRVEG